MGKWVPSADFKRFLERVARRKGDPAGESLSLDDPSGTATQTANQPSNRQHTVVTAKGTGRSRIPVSPPARDVIAQCPKCKTVETIQLIGDTLAPSRKFRQRDGGVYHDCGADQPCRLHR